MSREMSEDDEKSRDESRAEHSQQAAGYRYSVILRTKPSLPKIARCK